MLKIYSHENRFFVWNVKAQLEAAGISCQIRNEYAAGGAGDLSPFDVWPEIWVSDQDVVRALSVIEQFHKQQRSELPVWRCQQCGEENEGVFEFCWQCGTPRSL